MEEAVLTTIQWIFLMKCLLWNRIFVSLSATLWVMWFASSGTSPLYSESMAAYAELREESPNGHWKGNWLCRLDSLVEPHEWFWDNGIPGYGKTRKLSSAEKKKVNTLVTDIITKLTDEYDAETADAVWVREVVNRCMFPEVEQKRSTPTFIDRFEQYWQKIRTTSISLPSKSWRGMRLTRGR